MIININKSLKIHLRYRNHNLENLQVGKHKTQNNKQHEEIHIKTELDIILKY